MIVSSFVVYFFFFFNDTATTEIYTLSLHDALPIFHDGFLHGSESDQFVWMTIPSDLPRRWSSSRSEEHTSELQSRQYLVCRLLLEKKQNKPLLIEAAYQVDPPLHISIRPRHDLGPE